MAISTTTNTCISRKTHIHTFIPPSLSSLSLSNTRFIIHVSFSSSPSPILEQTSSSTLIPLDNNNTTNTNNNLKFSDPSKQYSNPESALADQNLNEFVCSLFKDPQTESLAFEYYQRLKERPEFRPEESTLRHVLRYLLRFKKWDSVLSVSHDFKSFRVLPDKPSCSRLISVCISSRKFKIAEALLDVFEDFNDDDVAVLALDCAMRGYNRLHMYRSTISVFERRIIQFKFKPTKLVPHYYHYNRCYLHAMEAYMRLGDCDKVVQLFHELENSTESFSNNSSSTRFLGKIYGIVCEALGQSGRAFEALKYWREMNKKGVYKYSMYSTLICSFASLREVEMAEEILREAKRKRVMKDPEVYFKLVLMYVEEGLLERTLEVVKDMKNAGVNVSDGILCAIINGFSKRRGFQDATTVYEQLVSEGHEAGQVTYASIINAYCRLGQYSKAEKVFSEMEQKGIHKCVVAYASMVVMYGRIGKLRDAMRIVAKMKERGCQPNVWVYNSLIDMHGRAKNLRQVEKLWSEMKRRKIVPDKVTYTSIITAYSKTGEFEKCINFFKEHRMNGGEIDRAMAGIMVMVFSKVGQVDELVKLLRDMKMEGTRLDERLYFSACNALTEAGMQVHARWLQESFQVT